MKLDEIIFRLHTNLQNLEGGQILSQVSNRELYRPARDHHTRDFGFAKVLPAAGGFCTLFKHEITIFALSYFAVAKRLFGRRCYDKSPHGYV